MDAIALMEAIKAALLDADDERLADVLIADAPDSGLPTSFIVQERASGRQWTVRVALLER